MEAIRDTYTLSVCPDCIMWDTYDGSGMDGARVDSDDIRDKAWNELADAIGAQDMDMSYRDPDTNEPCAHDGECYCRDTHFSRAACELCGQIAGTRYSVIITGFTY